jgi:hypothetical protein
MWASFGADASIAFALAKPDGQEGLPASSANRRRLYIERIMRLPTEMCCISASRADMLLGIARRRLFAIAFSVSPKQAIGPARPSIKPTW